MTIRFAMLAMGVVLSLIELSAAQGQTNEQEKDFAVNKAASEIGIEMFLEIVKREGALIRTSALLEGCDQKGLSIAVAEKIKDRDFAIELQKMILEGRFNNLPTYALHTAQAVARYMGSAFQIGYRQGAMFGDLQIRYLPGSSKSADQLLRK